jgi:hypothetical protein
MSRAMLLWGWVLLSDDQDIFLENTNMTLSECQSGVFFRFFPLCRRMVGSPNPDASSRRSY